MFVGKLEERGLSGAEPQVGQVHAAVGGQDAAVGAEDDCGLLRERRAAQLQHRRLLRPVEGGHVALALIPHPQVRQGGGGVREEEEVSEQQGALFTTKLAQAAEKTATGQTLGALLLPTESAEDQYSTISLQYCSWYQNYHCWCCCFYWYHYNGCRRSCWQRKLVTAELLVTAAANNEPRSTFTCRTCSTV